MRECVDSQNIEISLTQQENDDLQDPDAMTKTGFHWSFLSFSKLGRVPIRGVGMPNALVVANLILM